MTRGIDEHVLAICERVRDAVPRAHAGRTYAGMPTWSLGPYLVWLEPIGESQIWVHCDRHGVSHRTMHAVLSATTSTSLIVTAFLINGDVVYQ